MTYRGNGAVYRWYLETVVGNRLVWSDAAPDLGALGTPLVAVAYVSGPEPVSADVIAAWRETAQGLPTLEPSSENLQLDSGEQITTLTYR
jgi:hypothetical protein